MFWKQLFKQFTRKLLPQAVVLGLVLLAVWWLLDNLTTNLNRTNIPTDFEFLTSSTNFHITDNPGFSPDLPIWRMLLIGIQNTLLAAGVAVVIATLLGILIGTARLSSNWLIAKFAQFYVEAMRNVPLLVVILFIGGALFTFGPLPVISEAHRIANPFGDGSLFIFSNSYIGMPSLGGSGNAGLFNFFLLLSALAAAAVWFWRTRLNIRTGVPHRRIVWSLGSLLALALVFFLLTGTPYGWSLPDIVDTRQRIGGFYMSYSYVSITLALGLYTASHIAEIVRGSLMAIPKGQGEAAYALTPFQKYRYVLLPQALPTAVPPFINQYLNVTKNSTLGIVVAYPETANLIETAIGNGKPAPQLILVMMLIFLFLSLVISGVGNAYNGWNLRKYR